MTRYVSDLYGFELDDLEAACQAVELALGIKLDAHESWYLGGDYYRKDFPSGELILRTNVDLLWESGDPPEDQYAEPEFSDYPILLSIDDHPDPDVLQEQLTKSVPTIRHLRREEHED